MKKILSLGLCVAIMCSMSTVAMAAEEKPITVVLENYHDIDGNLVESKTVEFDVDPIIIDGRTMVPIRAVAEKLGYKVSWDGATNTVGLLGVFNYNDTHTSKGTNYMIAQSTAVKDFYAKLQDPEYSGDFDLNYKGDLRPDGTQLDIATMEYFTTDEKKVVSVSLKTDGSKDIDVGFINFSDKIIDEDKPIVYDVIKNSENPLYAGVYFYYTTDVAPVIIDGRTLLPLRAVAECLGLQVAWDGDTRTVTISTEYGMEKPVEDPEDSFLKEWDEGFNLNFSLQYFGDEEVNNTVKITVIGPNGEDIAVFPDDYINEGGVHNIHVFDIGHFSEGDIIKIKCEGLEYSSKVIGTGVDSEIKDEEVFELTTKVDRFEAPTNSYGSLSGTPNNPISIVYYYGQN